MTLESVDLSRIMYIKTDTLVLKEIRFIKTFYENK